MERIGLYWILIIAGFLAGIVNTIAGGGSFLTLPALMLFGLDPKTANATNRVAVLLSSGSAVATFQKHGHLDRRLAIRLTIPTMLGVPLGALLAVYLPSSALEPVLGILFLGMAVLLVFRPNRLLKTDSTPKKASHVMWLVFFVIGIYVGFIQAGMGILVLLAMGFFHGGNLVESNAVKNWLAFSVTLLSMLVFAYFGLIQWLPGMVMGAGNLLGGIVGAKLAIKKGNPLIFSLLIIVMVATGLKLVVSSFMG